MLKRRVAFFLIVVALEAYLPMHGTKCTFSDYAETNSVSPSECTSEINQGVDYESGLVLKTFRFSGFILDTFCEMFAEGI